MFGNRFLPPPPALPPPPSSSPLVLACWRLSHCRKSMTVNDWWALREAEQDARNRVRRADWETRFKVLGPRPQDLPGVEPA